VASEATTGEPATTSLVGRDTTGPRVVTAPIRLATTSSSRYVSGIGGSFDRLVVGRPSSCLTRYMPIEASTRSRSLSSRPVFVFASGSTGRDRRNRRDVATGAGVAMALDEATGFAATGLGAIGFGSTAFGSSGGPYLRTRNRPITPNNRTLARKAAPMTIRTSR